MPIIKRSCIEDMRIKINIYDVVSPYVSLKKTGSSWRGLSPFNPEKTPSFYVLPEKNIFKCFSSGYAGDIFRFIQLKENVNFQEAVEMLAGRFNITLDYEEGVTHDKTHYSLKKHLLELHESARTFYEQAFWSTNPLSQEVRDYWLIKRGLSEDSAKRFKIGFALPEDRSLVDYLLDKGFSLEHLKQSGLFYCKDHDTHPSRLKPRFSGRLIIPIEDVQGRTIAFTARQLPCTPTTDPARDAKYINSPETPIFNKSQVLFGLDKARTQALPESGFIFVEGQLDVIRCHECGITNAIAPQGTAITESQLTTIKRYTHQLECLMDADSAGIKAGLRLIPMALDTDLEVSFLQVPTGMDPDSFFAQEGPQGLDTLRREALTPITYALKYWMPTNPTPRQKADVIDRLFEMIHHCSSSLIIEEYLKEIASQSHVNLQILKEDFKLFVNKSKKQNNNKLSKKPLPPSNPSKEKLTTAEYELLLVILHYQELTKPIAHLIDLEWICTHNLTGKLLVRFLNEFKENMRCKLEPLDELLESDEEFDCVYTILSQKPPFANPVKSANVCIQSLYNQYIESTKDQLDREIASLDSSKQSPLRELLQKRIELRKLKQNTPQLEPILNS